jgi:hypothetical protein
LSIAPGWQDLAPVDQFTLTPAALTLKIIWDPAYDHAAWLYIYLSLPLRQSSLKLRRSLFLVSVPYHDALLTEIDVTSLFESLANVSWAVFYASADCSIICRILNGWSPTGFTSTFVSSICKID